MKKTLSTLLSILFVLLITSTFAMAESVATAADTFPYFQLGCLLVGGLIMVSLKDKYSKIHFSELAGAFSLYTILVALFTNPVIDSIKYFVG